MTPSELLQYA